MRYRTPEKTPERRAEVLARCDRQVRSNERWLHRWNPFRFMLEGPHENLLRAREELRAVMVERGEI